MWYHTGILIWIEWLNLALTRHFLHCWVSMKNLLCIHCISTTYEKNHVNPSRFVVCCCRLAHFNFITVFEGHFTSTGAVMGLVLFNPQQHRLILAINMSWFLNWNDFSSDQYDSEHAKVISLLGFQRQIQCVTEKAEFHFSMGYHIRWLNFTLQKTFDWK